MSYRTTNENVNMSMKCNSNETSETGDKHSGEFNSYAGGNRFTFDPGRDDLSPICILSVFNAARILQPLFEVRINGLGLIYLGRVVAD